MTKSALILIDIQNDYFADGKWPVDKMLAAGKNAARLLENARKNGDMVVHIQHIIPSKDAPFFAEGSKGGEINALVAPATGEAVVQKLRPNGFHGTALRDSLEEAGISELTICGAMSQMCIDATTRAAADFGYAVTLVEDACGAKELAYGGKSVPADMVHTAFMAALASAYAKVVSTEDFLSNSR